MQVEPEVQAEFDRLMKRAVTMGGMMADTVLVGNPPPWDEAWFKRFYENVIKQAGEVFRTKWPELSETVIANMQVRFCDGLEARFKTVLGSGQYLSLGDKGAAN